MAFNPEELAAKVAAAESGTASEAFKALESGIYTATIVNFGHYENAFKSETLNVRVKIGENEFSMDKGFTLKDGKDNTGTLSLMKEVLAATGVDIATAVTTPVVVKAFGKDVQLNQWSDSVGKDVSAFVRETYEEAKGQYAKGNNIENIFKVDNTNSAGADQSETFLAKITETPVQVKTSKKKATAGTAGAAQNASAAAARI